MSEGKKPRKLAKIRERAATAMIDQAPMPPPGDASTLDETRLRQQAIGVRLRQLFDEVVNEPVPDEFLEILRRADRSPTERKG